MTVIDSVHLLLERLALHHLLSTMRSHDQYNTTLYSRADRYRGVFGQRYVVFVNQRELKRRGLRPGERVDIDVFAKKHVEGFWLCFLQEFGPTESVSQWPIVREARLLRFLRLVAGVGLAHPANNRKQWTAAICRTDNGPSTREPHESD
jgi:hypothetical protein